MPTQNAEQDHYYEECETHFKNLIKDSEIINDYITDGRNGKTIPDIYENLTRKLELKIQGELSNDEINKLELKKTQWKINPDTKEKVEITHLDTVKNDITKGLSLPKFERIFTGGTRKNNIYWLLFAEGIPSKFWPHTALLVEEWGCKRNPKCTKTFKGKRNKKVDGDSLLQKLENQHVVLYFNKKVDSRFYRTFLHFENLEYNSERKYQSLEVKYCGENNISLNGKAFLDENYNLIIMLHSEKGKHHQTFTWRGILDRSLSDTNFEETVMVGVRTINKENTQELYSGMAILRLPSSKIKRSRFNTKIRRKPKLITKINSKDTIEKEILLHLSFIDSYKVSQFTTNEDLTYENNTKSGKLGREGFDALTNLNLHQKKWISFSRVLDSPDERVAISHMEFTLEPLAKKMKMKRTSKEFIYAGEVQYSNKDRLWFQLSDKETRKFILGIPVEDIILCLGTYVNTHLTKGSETLMLREVMVPVSKLSSKIKAEIKKKFYIPYHLFLSDVELNDEYKTYLSSRSESVLSFPNPENESTNYGKKLLSSLYEGQYFLFLYDQEKKDGSLLQFTLKIDSLGNAEYRKSAEVSIKRKPTKTWFQYRGESFAFSKTLVIQSEHIMHYDKRYNKFRDEISKQQNPQLSFVIDPSKDKKDKPSILFGQISDTDKIGLPDCSACIAISIEKFDKKRFITGIVKNKSPHYRDIQAFLNKHHAFENLNEHLDEKISTIEDFFRIIGQVQFRS